MVTRFADGRSWQRSRADPGAGSSILVVCSGIPGSGLTTPRGGGAPSEVKSVCCRARLRALAWRMLSGAGRIMPGYSAVTGIWAAFRLPGRTASRELPRLDANTPFLSGSGDVLCALSHKRRGFNRACPVIHSRPRLLLFYESAMLVSVSPARRRLRWYVANESSRSCATREAKARRAAGQPIICDKFPYLRGR